jgi:hypothetical protein
MEKSGVLTDQILGAYGPKEACYFANLNFQFLFKMKYKYSRRHKLFKTVSYNILNRLVIRHVVFKVINIINAKDFGNLQIVTFLPAYS